MKQSITALVVFLSLGLSATGVRGADGIRDGAFVVVDDLPIERATLFDGSGVDVRVQRVWRPMCGSDLSQLDRQSFENMVTEMRRSVDQEQGQILNTVQRAGGGMDLVFSVIGSIPAAATTALGEIEAYIESQFTDPVTIVITFRMQALGPGVLGGTSSSYLEVQYPTVRDSIQADMDPDDVIQDWLPDTSTVPVRYNASSATVTNENRVFVTRANYNAAIGTAGGSAASMTMSTNFSWDYDPSNGITINTWDFQSVLVHEIGHALGFTSGVDFRNGDIEMLDLYRFQRTDGTGDYNPDDFAEFQTTARTIDFNNLNNDVNSDIVDFEYRMSDGDPSQASHFQDNLGIGIMDPTLGSGQSFYPNFYRDADRNMLDAIGWDVIDCTNNPLLDDLNNNNIADMCERIAPSPESSGTNCGACLGEFSCINGVCYTPKNRYFSLSPDNPGSLTALRVIEVGSGTTMWIGEPDANGYASLVAAPEYRDWDDFAPVIHVSGCLISPNHSYDVQSILDVENPLDEGAYSPTLTLPTVGAWGDVTGPDGVPSGTANLTDVNALVGCFQGNAGALSRQRCDLGPQTPNGVSNLADVSDGVSGFQGLPYPYAAPNACP